MISSKNFKDKRMILTSHYVQSRKIAKRLEAIPVEKQTPEQKRFLADVSDEERGIITIGDIHEEKARSAAEKAAGEASDSERAAEAEKIAEQKRKEAIEEAAKKKPAPKKAKGVKSGSKKKA